MKYAFAAAALVAAVSAQDISTIPSCAIPCIDASRAKVTTCGETDYKCLCDNITAIQGDATTCVISACGATVAVSDVLPATQAFCAAVEAGGSSSSAPAETTSSVVASTSVVATTSEVATTSVAETTATASATTSAGYSVSIPEGTTTLSSSSYKATTIVSTHTSKASNGTATATTAPTSVVTAGAAIATAGPVMLALAALAAAF